MKALLKRIIRNFGKRHLELYCNKCGSGFVKYCDDSDFYPPSLTKRYYTKICLNCLHDEDFIQRIN